MPNINISKLNNYNSIIRDNRRATKRLEQDAEFPLARFDIILSPFSKEDYSNLIDWTGKKNAMYFSRCLSDFYKKWIVINTGSIVPTSYFDENKKSDKLILDISDCFEVQNINIDTMSFFKTLKKEPYFEDLAGQAHFKKYGTTTISASVLGLNVAHNLELSIVKNSISLRQY